MDSDVKDYFHTIKKKVRKLIKDVIEFYSSSCSILAIYMAEFAHSSKKKIWNF